MNQENFFSTSNWSRVSLITATCCSCVINLFFRKLSGKKMIRGLSSFVLFVALISITISSEVNISANKSHIEMTKHKRILPSVKQLLINDSDCQRFLQVLDKMDPEDYTFVDGKYRSKKILSSIGNEWQILAMIHQQVFSCSNERSSSFQIHNLSCPKYNE